jgi:hypothetical protein
MVQRVLAKGEALSSIRERERERKRILGSELFLQIVSWSYLESLTQFLLSRVS